MTIHTPIAMQPTGSDPEIDYTQQEVRNWIQAQLGAAAGFEGQEGVVGSTGTTASPSGAFAVTQRGAGANFSVDIAPGRCFITDDDITNGGLYEEWMDATFNLVTPSPPSSGTRHHRVVLQLRNKSESGGSNYDMIPVLVPDTGSGLPAEPASAISIAQVDISAAQVSVTNSAITDLRQQVGPNVAFRTTDLQRTGTGLADDGQLQLAGLRANARYKFEADIFYDGGAGASETDLQWTFRQGSGSPIMRYSAARQRPDGVFNGGFMFNGSDTATAGTTGVGTGMKVTMSGTIITGSPAPQFLVMQWAPVTNNGTNTTIYQRSLLRAAPMA